MSQSNTVVDDELIETIDEGYEPQQDAADEEFVISSSISKARVQSFLAGYLQDRAKAATAEELFERVDALVTRAAWREDRAYGFNVLLHKGPFVEGSHWLPYRTWEFATAAERHVMHRLERTFREVLPRNGEGTVPRIAHRIIREIDRLVDVAGSTGHNPTLVAFAGDVETETLVDLFNYIAPRRQSSIDVDLPWIIGAYREMPILQFPSTAAEPAIYIADLHRLGTFVRYGSLPRFDVTEFDGAGAAELIDRDPNVVALPSGRPDTRDERIRQLRLHVNLKLYECNDIEVRDDSAVRGVRLDRSDITSLSTVISEVRRQQAVALNKGWQLLRLELGVNPYKAVKEAHPDGRLQVDNMVWDVVEGSIDSQIMFWNPAPLPPGVETAEFSRRFSDDL